MQLPEAFHVGGSNPGRVNTAVPAAANSQPTRVRTADQNVCVGYVTIRSAAL